MSYPAYVDITSRISEPPTWWCLGVPRYKAFDPHDVDGYEAILLKVACQYCGQVFSVCHYSPCPQWERIIVDDQIATGALRDDPPRHFDCRLPKDVTDVDDCTGVVMGFEWLEIVEVWERPKFENRHGAWRRRPDLEGS